MNPNAIKLELSASMDQESVAEVKGIVNELNGALSAAEAAAARLSGMSLGVDIVINKHMVEKPEADVRKSAAELAIDKAFSIQRFCDVRNHVCAASALGICPFYLLNDNRCVVNCPASWDLLKVPMGMVYTIPDAEPRS